MPGVRVSHADDIKQKIASGSDAIIMLGTGFSSAVAKDKAHASWVGLLRAGLEYLKTNGLIEKSVLVESIEQDIQIGIELDSSFLVAVGEKISSLMHRTSSPHFAAFLRDTVGALEPDSGKAELARTIEQLNAPVMTTNYDTLYEQITKKPSITWSESRKFRTAIKSQSTDVIHLHGIWDDPESVILTTSDYEKILRHEDTAALRQSIGVLKTIIFVGYGAGLNDPHFQALWNFLKPLVAENVVHYTLCLEQDLVSINRENFDTPIIPVAYGDNHDQLEPFLKQLVPPTDTPQKSMTDARTASQIAETCRLQILDRLADTTLLPGVIDNPSVEYAIEDLVVEPSLLPVPPDQFATEKANGNDEMQRLNAVNEVMNSSSMVIVGEEQAGVSTALAWATLTRCGVSPTHLPIILDYKLIGQGNKWVQNAIRKHLRASGAPLSNRDPLPPNLVIAIDNFTAANERDLIRTIDDLKSVDPALVIYGVRPGSERPTQRRIGEARPAIVAYLGRVGRRHAIELARRVVPERATPLADRVLKIARKEGLARNPLSILLLIVGVNNDEGWINSVSNTTFIDSFVDSLLGRGAWRDDMHLQIDSGGYSRVLQSFATELINCDSESLPWLDSVRHFEEIVRRLDWSDNAQDIARRLIGAGILVNRDGRIFFRQSVYLHIFAARACRQNPELLAKLRSRPLYYAPIIRHYAALVRSDEKVLKWAVDLIQHVEEAETPKEALYRCYDAEELEHEANQLERLAEAVEESPDPDAPTESSPKHVEEPEQSDSTGKTETAESDDDPYEQIPDDQRSPFPAHDLDNAPDAIRLPAQLSLISNILRDSELVENADLKELGLRRVLAGWGLHMNQVHDSPGTHNLIEGITQFMAERFELSEQRRSELATDLKQVWAMVMIADAITEDLATIKLEKALQRVLNDTQLREKIHIILPALILGRSLEVQEDYDRLSEILVANSVIAGTRIYLDTFVRSDYVDARDGSLELTTLENTLVNYHLSLHPNLQGRRRKTARSKLIERYRRRRTRIRMRRQVQERQDLLSSDSTEDSD